MIYPPFCLGSVTLCILLGAGQAQAKQGGVGTALEAMLLSMASHYLIAVLVEGTTQDLWYLKSLFYSTALILVVHVHDKHDHNDLFHRHRSDH